METKVNALAGGLGVVTAALVSPPVFRALLAMGPLSYSQRAGLLAFSFLLLASSAYLIVRRRTASSRLALLLVAALALIGIELGARLTIVVVRPDMKPGMAALAAITYPERTAYRGHPFLQFTGNPDAALVGNVRLGNLSPFNSYGFLGPDLPTAKPAGVIRIAALGGSTTASGYPALLERLLNDQGEVPSRFEAMNLGHGWYTTAHSLVNFVLNVVDFDPDYVIIHHAWNDRMARDAGAAFRGDYSHALKAFERPDIIDAVPIRVSVLYRYLKTKLDPQPLWASLGAAIERERPRPPVPFQDLRELAPFERNVRTIVDLARLRGIRVVLTTQPHSTDPDILYGETAPQIAQCNDVLRALASAYGDEVLFVDLDRMMTGTTNHLFRDVGHLVPEGRRFKAERIGEAILADLAANPA